ncbi:hypothetical protein Holit_01006 [Hollandina sp. SP2]
MSIRLSGIRAHRLASDRDIRSNSSAPSSEDLLNFRFYSLRSAFKILIIKEKEGDFLANIIADEQKPLEKTIKRFKRIADKKGILRKH